MNKWILVGASGIMMAGCGAIVNVSGGANQIVGSGKVSSISRKVDAFKSVNLDGAMDIEVKIGPQSEIKIEGDDNLLTHVRTVVKNGALHVDTDTGYSTHNPLKVSFTIPQLDDAALNGSGDIDVQGASGKDISLLIQGSGNLKADGSAGHLIASITGSGDLQLSGLRAKDADVDIIGSGDAKVNVSGKITAAVSGSGSIKYFGHPAKVDKSVSGSGEIGPGE